MIFSKARVSIWTIQNFTVKRSIDKYVKSDRVRTELDQELI